MSMLYFQNRKAAGNSYSLILVAISLGTISVISGLSEILGRTNQRVPIVLVIVGSALMVLGGVRLSSLKKFDLDTPSEIFSFTFAFLVSFIVVQSCLYLATGVVSTLDAAILESTSSITTTAISTLDPDSLTSSMHTFRSLTQWVGGLFALFLVFVATPITSNSDNPSAGYGPKIFSRKPAKRMREITILYLGLTLITFVALFLAGMGAFDSFAHSLSASSTGGFSTRSSSIASFESAAIEWTLICSMFVGGLNVGLIWWVGKGKFVHIRSNNELRLYLVMFFGGVGLFWLKGDLVGPFSHQLRDAFFKLSSLFSTTGFVNDGWRFSSGITAVALLILAVGGMAGSPGGGFGIHRLIELMKYLRRELTRKYNRQAVRKIKVSGEVVNERELGKLQGFTAIFIFIVASGAFLLALDNSSLSIADVISISVSAFVTAGPAITESGSENSYGLLGNVALSMLMIVGRLSILPAAYMVLKLSRSAKLNLRGLRANGVSSDEIP